MDKNTKKIIRIILGILLILGGIAGLFLPVIQGTAMIIAGIFLICPSLGKKIIRPFKKLYHKTKRFIKKK
jgi:uncharacterized membrane protein YbaN (DUF454 family)